MEEDQYRPGELGYQMEGEPSEDRPDGAEDPPMEEDQYQQAEPGCWMAGAVAHPDGVEHQ